MKILIITVLVILLIVFLCVVIAACIETSRIEKIPMFKVFLPEVGDDFKEIAKSLFVPGRDKSARLKHIQQTGLYLFEIFLVCGLVLILWQWLSPVDVENLKHFFYEQMIRFLTAYTAYQLFVFAVLSLKVSAEKDMWAALLDAVDLKLYLLEYPENSEAKQALLNRLSALKDPYTFVSGEPVELVDEIMSADREKLKFIKLKINHELETASLYWRFSLLLEKMK